MAPDPPLGRDGVLVLLGAAVTVGFGGSATRPYPPQLQQVSLRRVLALPLPRQDGQAMRRSKPLSPRPLQLEQGG